MGPLFKLQMEYKDSASVAESQSNLALAESLAEAPFAKRARIVLPLLAKSLRAKKDKVSLALLRIYVAAIVDGAVASELTQTVKDGKRHVIIGEYFDPRSNASQPYFEARRHEDESVPLPLIKLYQSHIAPLEGAYTGDTCLKETKKALFKILVFYWRKTPDEAQSDQIIEFLADIKSVQDVTDEGKRLDSDSRICVDAIRAGDKYMRFSDILRQVRKVGKRYDGVARGWKMWHREQVLRLMLKAGIESESIEWLLEDCKHLLKLRNLRLRQARQRLKLK